MDRDCEILFCYLLAILSILLLFYYYHEFTRGGQLRERERRLYSIGIILFTDFSCIARGKWGGVGVDEEVE